MNNTAKLIISAIAILAMTAILSFIVCGAGAAGSSSYFSVVDGELKTNQVAPFSFAVSGTKPTVAKETQAEFKKVADHLKNNEDRALSLVGNYYISENTKGDVDLGMARAEAIQSRLEKLGAPDGSVTISSRRLNNIEVGDKTLYNAVDFVFSEKKTDGMSGGDSTDSFSESGGSSIMSGFAIPFESGQSSFDDDGKLSEFIEIAKAYIEGNPSGKINITGYSSSESESVTVARKIRRIFRSDGFERDNLSFSGKVESERSEDDPLFRRIVLEME